MVDRKGTYINSLEASLTEPSAYKMKELNPLYYALIDSNNRYYTAKEIAPYLDLKIVFNDYKYEITNGKVK